WEEAAWLLVGGPRPPLAGAGPAREPVQTTPRRTRRLRDRLRVLARDDRRPLACRLRRAARRSQRTRRDRVPPARAHPVWRARRAGACADERQRLLLRRRRLRPHPRPARDPTSPHAPVPAPHKRQSQTPMNDWAYARVYGSNAERAAALQPYLTRYNYRRPHGSLGHQPPASRLNNLVRNYNYPTLDGPLLRARVGVADRW